MYITDCDNQEFTYKCNRCGGVFVDQITEKIQCPFCAMPCDAEVCKIMDDSVT